MSGELHFTNDVTPDRDPDQRTALSLVRAFGAADVEGVEILVNTTDQARLAAVLTGLCYELVLAIYGPDQVDQALEQWLMTGQPPRPERP